MRCQAKQGHQQGQVSVQHRAYDLDIHYIHISYAYRKDMMPWEQCIQFAQWIPCGINMFCILKDVFHMEPLIEIMRNSTLNDSDVDDDLIAWDSLANM